MKYLAVLALLLLSATVVFAISIEEIAHLSQLDTSDELIIDLIEKQGIDRAPTSKDVILLKERGVSERVIQHVMKAAESQVSSRKRAAFQNLPESMRAYDTTDKNGKKIRVVTNLDQKGKRIGGELPPMPPRYEPPPAQRSYDEESDIPREVRVIVEQEQQPRPEEMEEEYFPNDRYGRPVPLDLFGYGGGGFPYYPGFPYLTPPYPFPPSGKCHHCKGDFFRRPHGTQAHWRTDAGYGRPRSRTFHKPSVHRRQHAPSQGARSGPR